MKTTGRATRPSRVSRPPVPLKPFFSNRYGYTSTAIEPGIHCLFGWHTTTMVRLQPIPALLCAPYILRAAADRAITHRGKLLDRNHQISPMPAMAPFAAARTLWQPQRLHRPSAATPQTRKHPKPRMRCIYTRPSAPRIAGEGEDAHQPRGDRPRRRRQVDDDGSLDLQMRRH